MIELQGISKNYATANIYALEELNRFSQEKKVINKDNLVNTQFAVFFAQYQLNKQTDLIREINIPNE